MTGVPKPPWTTGKIRVWLVPPDTFVDDELNITAFLVSTGVLFWGHPVHLERWMPTDSTPAPPVGERLMGPTGESVQPAATV